MKPDVLLDSVIVIDFLNGIPAARAYVVGTPSGWGISPVTYAEVLVGIPDAAEPATRAYLDAFRLYEIDREVAALAGRLRRLHRWKLPDALQAAVAEHNGLRLATRNTKDFDPDRHPFVFVPYTL